jgi:hypothetical protein
MQNDGWAYRVDGEVAGPDTPLRAGCVLVWTRPPNVAGGVPAADPALPGDGGDLLHG